MERDGGLICDQTVTLTVFHSKAGCLEALRRTSENAVKSQVWLAVTVYVLVPIVKKRLGLSASLYEALQISSLTMFETTPINSLTSKHPARIQSFHPTN